MRRKFHATSARPFIHVRRADRMPKKPLVIATQFVIFLLMAAAVAGSFVSQIASPADDEAFWQNSQLEDEDCLIRLV
jgi:hypothetical protein